MLPPKGAGDNDIFLNNYVPLLHLRMISFEIPADKPKSFMLPPLTGLQFGSYGDYDVDF
jgi:hypothetical protein